MIGDSGRFLAIRSAGSEKPEHSHRKITVDFSAQEFWALGAPWSHYVGSPLIHATHNPRIRVVVQPVPMGYMALGSAVEL